MLVCNDTPFFHGTKLTARRPPQAELVLVVRGTFRLVPGGVVEVIEDIDQGFLTGETFADDDPERAGEALDADDFADFKLRGEILLMGSCHPPKKAATRCPVRLALDDWHKALIVYGDRTWKRGVAGKTPSDPEPFDSMPLDWAHAFGGPGFDANPVGCGLGDRVPNVELPSAPIQTSDDRPSPACFGPISSMWASRAGRRGTNYGADYANKRAPYYADDFDWSYFSAAPIDQRLAQGFFRGDESLALTHLHPDHALLETKLPGLRIRAFARDDRGDFRAIVMQLDTIMVRPDEDRVMLTWRGHTPVREDDFEDVSYLLVASEPLTSAKLDDDHYRARLDAFIADPTGVLAEIPPEMMAAYDRSEKEKQGLDVAPLSLDPDLDPLTGTIKATFGSAVPDEALGEMKKAIEKLDDLPEGRKKPDLAEMVRASEEARRRQAPPMTVLKPGRLPPVNLRKHMRPLVEKAAELRAKEKETGQTFEGLDRLEKVPLEPKLKELDPDYTPPLEGLSDDPPGPGADLRERDFSDYDFRGVDLTGADLTYADLSRANLEGVSLKGADLSKAILYQARLTEADLSGANLTLCNAIAVRAEGADLTGATLSEADLEYARLKGATLDEVTADYVVLVKADLREVSAAGAIFDHADFSKAKLAGATLTGASAKLCLFGEADLTDADLGDTVLDQASFADADLSRARLIGAHAEKGFFMRCKLDGADLRWSVLASAHLTKASLVTAKLFGANLKHARLYRTRLDGADLSYANLMAADLRKASIEAVRFVEASLYDAKLLDVTGKHYLLDGANTTRMLLKEAR